MKHYHIDTYFFDIQKKILYIRGWLFLNDCEIVITIDRQEILREKPNQYRYDICQKYSDKKDKTNYGFEYELPLEKEYKHIQIQAEANHHRYTLFKTTVPTTMLEKKWVQVKHLIKKGCHLVWKKNIRLLNPFLIKSYIDQARENQSYQEAKKYYVNPNNSFQYRAWAMEKEKREKPVHETFSYQPLISIVVPVYNVDIPYLKACIDSVLAQTYPHFELCLADDCSTMEEIHSVLEDYQKKDKRIKVLYRKENGHISKASNSALSIATGEFISLLDNDDVLTTNALEEVVRALNQNPKYDLIYSDEDKLDMDNHLCFPTYKPDWSRDLFLCHNYLCHFTTIRKKQIDRIKGFRAGFEGAQDYDLFLRVIANIKEKNIYHIPKILYHWRMIDGSTAAVMSNKNYAFERGRKALEEYLKNEKIACKVERVKNFPYYKPNYKISKATKITFIVEGTLKEVKKCCKTIQKYHELPKYEILTSQEGTFYELVKKAQGRVILYLQAKVLLSKTSSVSSLVKYACQKHVGIVAPTLDRIGSYQRTSGVVLMENHYEPVIYSRRHRSTFVEPKLIIPHNYLVPSTKMMVFEKEKYIQVCGKMKMNAFPTVLERIQICLKFYQKGYFNLGDASNIFLYQGELEEQYEQQEYRKLHIERDPFYNPNLSQKYLYQLDLWKEEDEDATKNETSG